MNAFSPTEDDLNAYVDDQLDDGRRQQVERYLSTHPEAAAFVAQLMREKQSLRAALDGIPAGATPAQLDPAYIRRSLRARANRRLALAASFVLCMSLSVVGGWQLRDMSMRARYLPMADAAAAYRIFATGDAAMQMVDLKTSDVTQLQTWLDRRFVQSEPVPNFEMFGFRPVGARLMASEQGTAAMVLYRNASGQAIVYYMRPPGNLFHFDKGERKEGELLTQYWRRGKYFYALVSPAGQAALAPVQRAMSPLQG